MKWSWENGLGGGKDGDDDDGDEVVRGWEGKNQKGGSCHGVT